MIVIIGGGISGITAAVELAEAGFEVTLVEKEPFLGGNVVKMNNYFPKLCPPVCGLEINFRRIRNNPRITLCTSSTVKAISGEAGNFTITLLKEPEYIKNTCTSCGKCTEVCPQERPDTFNHGFGTTTAVYLPHEMAFPMKYSIDDKACIKQQCAKCLDICEYNAIDLDAKPESTDIRAGAIIVTTGWTSFDAGQILGLNYCHDNVLTNVEFERFLSDNGHTGGKLLRPSDHSEIKDLVFVQCAGSRDENYLPYCSGVCCSASLKHALSSSLKMKDLKIKIFYIDLRVSGRNEDFLNRVRDINNIQLIKGKVAEINNAENGDLEIIAEDILSGKKIRHTTNMVILAAGIVPDTRETPVSKQLYGFVKESVIGIIPAGCCKRPMDVSASVKDATAAAMKAVKYVKSELKHGE
ncbi:MAG: FAD-dependent oxidoreductase [Bacteroidota bacterium]